MPVDIKKAGVDGGLAVFKNVEPPDVIAPHDAHVVGDDVENESHAVFVKSPDKAVEVFGTADLRIERIVIDDVVAMHATRTSFEAGRDVTVADAKGRKIGNDGARLVESKLAVELQTIGRSRNLEASRHVCRDQVTAHGGSIPGFRSLSLTSL